MAIFGRESEPPYERPPLSKEYLLGENTFEVLYICPPEFWEGKQIDLLLGCEVTAFDPKAQCVTPHDGLKVGYGDQIWATGGNPRRVMIPGGDLAGVHAVRTRADADAILAELAELAGTERVVGIGVIPAVGPLLSAGAAGATAWILTNCAAPACPMSMRSATSQRTPMPLPMAR